MNSQNLSSYKLTFKDHDEGQTYVMFIFNYGKEEEAVDLLQWKTYIADELSTCGRNVELVEIRPLSIERAEEEKKQTQTQFDEMAWDLCLQGYYKSMYKS